MFKAIKKAFRKFIDDVNALAAEQELRRIRSQRAFLFFFMKCGSEEGTNGVFKIFNELSEKHPERKFSSWIVFKAWYKDVIDFAESHPSAISITLNNGKPYNKFDDPMYDPNAPDWDDFKDRDLEYLIRL